MIVCALSQCFSTFDNNYIVSLSVSYSYLYRYNSNLDEAKNFGIKKAIIAGAGMGAVFFFIFGVYALAFWYGSKLVREEEAYTAGRMIIVSR